MAIDNLLHSKVPNQLTVQVLYKSSVIYFISSIYVGVMLLLNSKVSEGTVQISHNLNACCVHMCITCRIFAVHMQSHVSMCTVKMCNGR